MRAPVACLGNVGAVVVSYNSLIPLGQFVQPVARIVSVLVVDNASTDGSAEACEVAWGVDVLRMHANLGYGAAVNCGVSKLPREIDYVLVLNPDVGIELEAVVALRARLENRSEVGLVAPRLRNLDGSEQLAARPFLTIGNQMLRRIGCAQVRVRGIGWTPYPDWVLGAAFMVRRRDFAALGGFDERFFLYCEDVDLCWRYRQSGFLVEQLEATWADHVYGRASSRLADPNDPVVRHHWRSMAHLAMKHPGTFSGVPSRLHRMATRRGHNRRSPMTPDASPDPVSGRHLPTAG